MSSIVEYVLFAALLLTTGSVVLMYRKLKRFDGLTSEYQRALRDAAAALTAARETLAAVHAESSETIALLGRKTDQAQRLIDEIDERIGTAAAAPQRSGDAGRFPPVG